ncbi:WhiB family transcriptional regulator [Micromonospora aurantiaca (nom. illeg.)]|uniref:WhiB family transcriptional regulator n=1 Tax=Micromonospora aurantiaca (nom. illeg.) TaxID=47850 RepID=UPI003EBA9203
MPLTLLGSVPAWHQQANCAGLGDAMFPERGDNTAVARAKFICGRCDVRDKCLTDALDRADDWGVRGGLSGIERRNLRRGTKEQQEAAA